MCWERYPGEQASSSRKQSQAVARRDWRAPSPWRSPGSWDNWRSRSRKSWDTGERLLTQEVHTSTEVRASRRWQRNWTDLGGHWANTDMSSRAVSSPTESEGHSRVGCSHSGDNRRTWGGSQRWELKSETRNPHKYPFSSGGRHPLYF